MSELRTRMIRDMALRGFSPPGPTSRTSPPW